MTLFRATLLLLVSLISSSIFAHEARVNPLQREAIRRRVAAASCGHATRGLDAGTRGISPGASRGATRGIEQEAPLPPAVEQYSNYFSQVIPAELDLPYGHSGDPKSHLFFRNEPYEGAEKIKVQEELGIRWNGDGAPSDTPTWVEMAKAYRAALERRGIDPASTFVPALVLYREVPGGEKPKREYLFIDPLKESFPKDMSQWRVLDKDTQFNIPFAPIFEAMQQGKFPLLDAVHDVSHFVSFLRFPEFAKAVRARMGKMTAAEVTSAFKGREYWLTEALSIPDPTSQSRHLAFLEANGRPTGVREIASIEKELESFDEKKLVDYAYRLARQFESELRDVSGGNSNAAEKWYYLSESFGMRAEDLLKEDISRSHPAEAAMGLAKVYFDNAPVTLNANPKTLTNETATFSYGTFVAAQKLLALSLKQDRVAKASRKAALRQLVRFASRTEWMLAQKPFTYEEWARAFLQPELAASDPMAQRLSRFFGNEIVPKYYLGKGQPRPPKIAPKP